MKPNRDPVANLQKHGLGGGFNLAADAARRHRRLPSVLPDDRGASVLHKWRVSAERFKSATPSPRLWKIHVGTGCVNDQPAVMQYARENDPRGWKMPADYAPFQAVAKIMGANHPFVDRPLWDSPRPFALLTAPSADDPHDLGGFAKVLNTRRPKALRSAADWERDLYQATVWVTVGFWKADPSLDLVRGTALQSRRRLQRWRVFAGKFPIPADNVRAGTATELARIYLLRDPGRPERDTIRIQQREFWNLRARAVEPSFGLAESFARAAELTNLAVLPIGAGGLAIGTALLAAEAALTDILLTNLSDLLESSGATLFWNQ